MKFKVEWDTTDSRQTEFVTNFIEYYKNFIDEKNPDFIVVIGGDGTMLKALKRNKITDQKYLGIGRGTVNFMLNKSDIALNFDKLDLSKITEHRVHPVEVQIKDADGNWKFVGLSFNDIVLGGTVMDWHTFVLTSNNHAFQDYNFKGSGVCFATPLGSTAYNANNGGSILPLDYPALSVTGIVANRHVNEIFDGVEILVDFETRTALNVYLDGELMINIPHKGSIKLTRSDERTALIMFKNGEFSRKRTEFLKERRR